MTARTSLIAACALVLLTGAASQEPAVTRDYSRPDAAIATSVTVPAGTDLIFFSGAVPAVVDAALSRDDPAAFGDTETQTASVLAQVSERLEARGLGLEDVVSMTVYLVGDPALDGRMDFAGMMRAYGRRFGTADQPNRPARSTVQVAGLAARGMLVEIEVTAARRPVDQESGS